MNGIPDKDFMVVDGAHRYALRVKSDLAPLAHYDDMRLCVEELDERFGLLFVSPHDKFDLESEDVVCELCSIRDLCCQLFLEFGPAVIRIEHVIATEPPPTSLRDGVVCTLALSLVAREVEIAVGEGALNIDALLCKYVCCKVWFPNGTRCGQAFYNSRSLVARIKFNHRALNLLRIATRCNQCVICCSVLGPMIYCFQELLTMAARLLIYAFHN